MQQLVLTNIGQTAMKCDVLWRVLHFLRTHQNGRNCTYTLQETDVLVKLQFGPNVPIELSNVIIYIKTLLVFAKSCQQTDNMLYTC